MRKPALADWPLASHIKSMADKISEEEVRAVLAPVPMEKTREREKTVREQFWPKLRAFAARVPFAEDAVAAFYCATDQNTPLKVRGTLLAALAYFIMPLDMIPDILAFVGLGDDIAVFTAAFTLVQSHVTDEHREKARDAIEREKSNTERPN